MMLQQSRKLKGPARDNYIYNSEIEYGRRIVFII